MGNVSRLYKFIIFVCIIQSGSLTTEARKTPANDSYVRTFPQTITVRVFLGEKISNFYLEDRKIGQNLRYLPNNNLELGLGATIHGIGLNFSTRLPGHNTKEDLYGHTKRYDLQLHRYSRKLMLDAYLQQYTGFHLKDKGDVSMIPGPVEYPYFPNLTARAIGVSGVFIFNGARYSLNNIVSQQEWQLRSAGSFLLGASVFSHLFSDDNSVLPVYLNYPDFFEGHHPKEIHYYGLTINAGYGYTLVMDKASHYFIAAAVDAGAGPGYGSVMDVNGENLKNTTYCLTANVRFGIGYNSNKWFAGLYFIYHTDRYPLPYSESALSTTQGIGRIVVARRISTRKKILAKQTE